MGKARGTIGPLRDGALGPFRDGTHLGVHGEGPGVLFDHALLAVHVLAGVLALGAGLGAVLTRKGGQRHNLAGRSFALTMAVVVLTALPLAAAIENWFLFVVAVFSGYLVFGGYRVIQRRRSRLQGPTHLDYAGHGFMLVVGGGMLAMGGLGTATGADPLAPALGVFGLIGASLAGSRLADLRRSGTGGTPWIRSHVGFMGGAYIATVTAAVTVNLTFLPALVRWLGPTVVGVPLIVLALRTYEPRFASG